MDSADARFIEYLTAKRSVDDRSLNPRVWSAFVRGVEDLLSRGAVEAVELGAGIGTMCERVFRALGTGGIRYHLVDNNSALLEAAGRNISAACFPGSGSLPGAVRLHTADAADWLAGLPPGHSFQTLLAHAFLDLVDIPFVLDRAFERLEPGGWAYLTINYEGRTDFIPALESDREILARYNESMRGWKGSCRGTDRSGGRILEYLLDRNYPILEAGASDWVVVPRPDGNGESVYTRDESIFLKAILDMVENSVSGAGCDPKILSTWMETRRTQAEERKLVYIAHQLDILARKPL